MDPHSEPRFANTRWSLVAALHGDGGGGDERARAPLLELCLHNWYPVYSYLRRCGHPPEVAQAMSQEFFDQLLQSAAQERRAAPRYGRFREFLVAELHDFLARARIPASDAAPGSPMALEALEARLRGDRRRAGSPEEALRRGFALGVIGDALSRLREEARHADRLRLFEALEPYLTGEPAPGELDRLGVELAARPLFLVLAVRRLRERFRELVDDTLGDTVLNTAELAAERQALLDALDGDRGG